MFHYNFKFDFQVKKVFLKGKNKTTKRNMLFTILNLFVTFSYTNVQLQHSVTHNYIDVRSLLINKNNLRVVIQSFRKKL